MAGAAIGGAAAGTLGSILNNLINKALEEKPAVSPATQMFNQFRPEVNELFGQTLTQGFGPGELQLQQNQIRQATEGAQRRGTEALLSGQFGKPTGVSQQSLANLTSQTQQNQLGAQQNLFLQQQALKRGALSGALGLGTQGFGQGLQAQQLADQKNLQNLAFGQGVSNQISDLITLLLLQQGQGGGTQQLGVTFPEQNALVRETPPRVVGGL